MLNKIASFALILGLTTIGIQTAFAKSPNDWNSVIILVNQEVAVQETNGQTVFGKPSSVNENEIVLQIADKSGYSGQSQTISRTNIKKIWRAELRFGERNTGKGAAIGAGVGAVTLAAIFIIAQTKEGDSAGGKTIGAGIGAVFGAALGIVPGAVVGFFSKKGHKKKSLVYEKQ
jgi:hypothetical protein